MAISDELRMKMERDREAYLKGDPNAKNAEKGAENAEIEKKQWENEIKSQTPTAFNTATSRPSNRPTTTSTPPTTSEPSGDTTPTTSGGTDTQL